MLNKSQFSETLLTAARNYLSNHQALIALNVFLFKDYLEIENCFKYKFEGLSKRHLIDLLLESVDNNLIEKFEVQKKGVFKIWLRKEQIESVF